MDLFYKLCAYKKKYKILHCMASNTHDTIKAFADGYWNHTVVEGDKIGNNPLTKPYEKKP